MRQKLEGGGGEGGQEEQKRGIKKGNITFFQLEIGLQILFFGNRVSFSILQLQTEISCLTKNLKKYLRKTFRGGRGEGSSTYHPQQWWKKFIKVLSSLILITLFCFKTLSKIEHQTKLKWVERWWGRKGGCSGSKEWKKGEGIGMEGEGGGGEEGQITYFICWIDDSLIAPRLLNTKNEESKMDKANIIGS